MGALLNSTAIERVLSERENTIEKLGAERLSDKAGLTALMNDGSAYDRAHAKIAAKESRLRELRASLEPLKAELEQARQREATALTQAKLADFERRKRKAAPSRKARYERAAAELGALANEMAAERNEAEQLRHLGLQAQPAISYEVLRFLHLPKWDGPGVIYCPPGADSFALNRAFLGRRS